MRQKTQLTQPEDTAWEGYPLLVKFQDEWPSVRLLETNKLLARLHVSHWRFVDGSGSAFENILSYLIVKVSETLQSHFNERFSFHSHPTLGTTNLIVCTADYEALCRDLAFAADEYCFQMTSFEHNPPTYSKIDATLPV